MKTATRPFKDLTRNLSPARRAKIEARKQELQQEMLMLELRQAMGMTQEDVAGKMGAKQSVVSKMEHAADLHISTLARWARALGGELRLVIDLPGKPQVAISGFGK